jgi:hypothetical protein
MTGMRISLKAINNELERRGAQAALTRGDGYFYFWGGQATDWLDRTVRVPTLHSLTLEQWIEQYRVLREKNLALLTGATKQKDFKKKLAELTPGQPDAEQILGQVTSDGKQSSDRESKYRRVAPNKSEPRQGKKGRLG